MQKQEHYLNPQMDPVDNLLAIHPIQTHWENIIEPYPILQLRYYDTPDCQFGNSSVPTKPWI
jgi:hypothetical protein